MTRDEWFTLMQRPAWMRRAACRGLSATYGTYKTFYPPPGEIPVNAFAICDTCPVRPECLAYALNTAKRNDHGVWGGTTVSDRRRIRKQRLAS